MACIPQAQALSCASGQKWQQAKDIFEQMKAARFKPDLATYTALLAAYHPANKWRLSLQVTASGIGYGQCAVLCCAVLQYDWV